MVDKDVSAPEYIPVEPRTLQYIAEACAGELVGGRANVLANGISTDSRRVREGDVFFAIKGDRYDGHDFLPEVAQAGAVAVVVNRTFSGCASIRVQDPRAALGQVAARYRRDFDLPVIAVTGSNGKTTTKELLASVLRQKFSTLWSEASFNNDIGVPVTLLSLNAQHRAAVLEAGTNHPGELRPLLDMIQPRYGVLTSIGREHLEFFHNLAGVAQEEGAIADVLPTEGRLFINGDDEWAPVIASRSRAEVIRVGLAKHNDLRAENVCLSDAGVRFTAGGEEYRTSLLGRHQVTNALLAVAVASELGLSSEEIRAGLAACKPAKMRMQVWEARGVRVLDDAYNANADSMLAALRTLQELPCTGRRIAVLGDMAELGEHSAAAHAEVGQRTADCGVKHLVAIGKWAKHTADAAHGAGLADVTEFADVSSAIEPVKELVRAGDLVLLKASRAAGFERIGEALRAGQ